MLHLCTSLILKESIGGLPLPPPPSPVASSMFSKSKTGNVLLRSCFTYRCNCNILEIAIPTASKTRLLYNFTITFQTTGFHVCNVAFKDVFLCVAGWQKHFVFIGSIITTLCDELFEPCFRSCNLLRFILGSYPCTLSIETSVLNEIFL